MNDSVTIGISTLSLHDALPISICGALPCCTKHWRYWPLGCMLSVCSYAPDTTSALPPTTPLSACAPPEKSLRAVVGGRDRKSTRPHSRHHIISYAAFCFKKITP